MFDKIYYGDTKLVNEKSFLLRIEFGLIVGYYQWEKILKDEFFDKLIEEKKCFRDHTFEFGSSTSYYYYCNKTTDISHFKPFIFSINDFENDFILNKEDLFIEADDKYIFIMIFTSSSDIILGYPFLKKYQLVFNQDSKTIGIYTEKKESQENNDYDIPSNNYSGYYIAIGVLGAVLIILIVIGILFTFKKTKNPKKEATELLNEKESDKNNGILIEDENKN